MFSANELLIVLVVTAAVALAVWGIVRSTRGPRSPHVSEALVRGTSEDVLSDLQLNTSGIRGTATHREAPHTLTMTWTYIPSWAFVVAIMVFPLGLIALLARTSVVGTVVVDQEPGGTVLMRMGGVFNKRTTRSINSVIEARSSASDRQYPVTS